MTTKRTNKQYPKEFKEEAVALVLEQGYTAPEAAVSLGLNASLPYKWEDKIEEQQQGISFSGGEREELKVLRKENKTLRMEKDI